MIKLVRLDYRLLHGQVVFSWTGHVGAQRIIVVDDDAANDEMKKSALLLSKPAGVRVNIFTVDKAIAKMPKVEQLDEKIMMIFGNTAALLKFCQAYTSTSRWRSAGLCCSAISARCCLRLAFTARRPGCTACWDSSGAAPSWIPPSRA